MDCFVNAFSEIPIVCLFVFLGSFAIFTFVSMCVMIILIETDLWKEISGLR